MNEERVHKVVEIGDVIVLPVGRRRIVVRKEGMGVVAINPYYPEGFNADDCLRNECIMAGIKTGAYKVVGNIYRL